jgi:predicted RNase H-like HicB family nuclease
MTSFYKVQSKAGGMMVKSYTLRAVVEEDTFPDGSMGYFAYVPELEHIGGATQGKTAPEALKNLQEVLQMIIEELIEEKQPIPTEAAKVSDEPLVTVTL